MPSKRISFKIIFQVVEGNHRPLLSARASRELELVNFCNIVSIQKPITTNSKSLIKTYRMKAYKIVDNHKELFEGYGKFERKVTLEVDPSISPSIQPPRRIPIALRNKLKNELSVLEKDGIIAKETRHTDWVSNIVIIQRGDPLKKNIRVC